MRAGWLTIVVLTAASAGCHSASSTAPQTASSSHLKLLYGGGSGKPDPGILGQQARHTKPSMSESGSDLPHVPRPWLPGRPWSAHRRSHSDS
jgi:hypothetical protein